MIRVAATLIALSLTVPGCGASPAARSVRADTKVITTAEIDATAHADAYTLVQSLRPQWLRVRGPTTAGTGERIHVYLDGSLMGGVEQLRQIATHSIASLRYLDGMEATQRWGLDHGAGAIVISTHGRT